uniref:Ep37-A2 n=1 Tax=Cynops pyrrhogaster TaxID=8330 RepID=O42344_CYNPY|nr:ep37-A2 [Cynops pyrrhogaster]
MNTITVYEHPNFQGLSRTFTTDVPRLSEHSFEDCISSAKVVGQPWLMYEHPNYQGWCTPLEEGEHSQTQMNDMGSSLILITEDLSNPMITVYEHPDYSGKAMVLTQEANLTLGDMNDKISSHKVQSGAWLLYEHPNRGGWSIRARAGEWLPNYWSNGFNDKVSHVYPLRPGKASATAKILWDKKKIESERNIQIDQYFYTNNTDIEQGFTATSTKEFEKHVSHSFEFGNETSVKVGTSFTLKGVVNIEAEASNTFTVKKGESESFTTRKKTELSMPVKAPPRTKVTVNFMCKEVTISVPVELKVAQGTKTVTESGTYRCESGTDTYIDVQSQAIGRH